MNLQPVYCACHHEEKAYCPDKERTVLSAWLANYQTATEQVNR